MFPHVYPEKITLYRMAVPASLPISGHHYQQANNIVVELTARVNGQRLTGYGECSPSEYYGDNQNDLWQFLKTVLKERLIDENTNLSQIADVKQSLAPLVISLQNKDPEKDKMAALSALEMATWDVLAKAQNIPLYKLLNTYGEDKFGKERFRKIDPAKTIETDFTIGLMNQPGQAQTLADTIDQALQKGFRTLKVKVNEDFSYTQQVLGLIQNKANKTPVTIYLDANRSWRADTLTKENLQYLKDHHVVMIEEPWRKDLSLPDRIRFYNQLHPYGINIIADESFHTEKDFRAVQQYADGINLKLTKTGGLQKTLHLIQAANSLVNPDNQPLKIMLGGFLESSLGVGALSHLAPLADYLDLDSAYLLTPGEDPFKGLPWEATSKLTLQNIGLSGIGVTPNQEKFTAHTREYDSYNFP